MTDEVLWAHTCPEGSIVELTLPCEGEAVCYQMVRALARSTNHLHLWEFDNSGADSVGDIHFDTGEASFISGGGMLVEAPMVITGSVLKLSPPFTFVSWLKPNGSQHGRVLSLSEDKLNINFELRQVRDEYSIRCRGLTDGSPSLSTEGGLAVPQMTQIVYTIDESGNDAMWVNGWKAIGGQRVFGTWGDYGIMLANIPDQDRPWVGEYHRIEILNKVLSEEEILESHKAGPRPSEEPLSLVETIRSRMWKFPRNEDAALLKYARAGGLGSPMTGEFDVAFGGVVYRVQGYAAKIIYCQLGDWGNIQEMNW